MAFILRDNNLVACQNIVTFLYDNVIRERYFDSAFERKLPFTARWILCARKILYFLSLFLGILAKVSRHFLRSREIYGLLSANYAYTQQRDKNSRKLSSTQTVDFQAELYFAASLFAIPAESIGQSAVTFESRDGFNVG